MSSYYSPPSKTRSRVSENSTIVHDDPTETAAAACRHTQSLALSLLLPIGLLFLLACLAGIGWLAIHGPVLVPRQDTRLTSIAISTGSKAASIIMSFSFTRSAWASAMPNIVSGRSLTTRSLVSICRQFMSLGQFQNFTALPISFKIHVLLGAIAVASMIATSSSFRYDSLPTTGKATAIVADVAFACPPQKVADTGLFICDEGGSNLNILTNTSIHSWDYIGQVDSGGQNTVLKYGSVGDEKLGANVTLAVLPTGWRLGDGNSLP